MISAMRLIPAMFVIVGLSVSSSFGAVYFNGFETDTSGWFASATRVASGNAGVTSATGGYHATIDHGTYTGWGGYNYGAGGGVPTVFQEYTTSLDIYLNVAGGWSNDKRFDYTSAINNNLGNHLRDFVFNAGFYNDGTGPGANTDRFVISAGNNAGRASSYPKNTGAIAISTTGWYTFQHHFYNNAGTLKVDMSIFDSSNSLVHSWTLGTDAIAGVGGNRYGWFANNEFGAGAVAIDNSELSTAAAVPELSAACSWAVLGLVMGGLGFRSRRHRKT